MGGGVSSFITSKLGSHNQDTDSDSNKSLAYEITISYFIPH